MAVGFSRRRSAYRAEFGARTATGHSMVDDGRRVVLADDASSRYLFQLGSQPWGMNHWRAQTGKLRYPGANEVAVGILIRRLLYWVINAQRVNARGTRLHLRLGEVNTWLVVGK